MNIILRQISPLSNSRNEISALTAGLDVEPYNSARKASPARFSRESNYASLA
jgi:hypothetical protein